MVLLVWLLPLATVIASPSALTFAWRSDVGEAYLPVPTLKFSLESDKDWRKPVRLPDGSNRRSIVYWNTTDQYAQTPGCFDYFDQPSKETWHLLWKDIFSSSENVMNSTFNQEAARNRSCGGNYNCTYTISFVGPGYKCQNVTNQPGGLINTSIIVPRGLDVYHADVDTGDYANPQFTDLRSGPGGILIGDIPDHAGDFRFEPELWIGWSYNTSQWLLPNSSFAKNWTHVYEPHIGRCIHYETNYTVEFNFIGQSCQIQSSSQFMAPILGFNFTQPNDGVLPVDQWLSPRDNKEAYKKTAAYHAIGQVFREVIRGHITLTPPIPGPYFGTVFSDITKTSLVKKNSEPVLVILERIEVLYQGIVLTFLAQQDMIVNSEETVLVQRSRYRIAFVYDSLRLWICYAPVILLTRTILLMGSWTIWQDGTTFSTGFSGILATTRNPTLDELSRGAYLGNDPFPEIS